MCNTNRVGCIENWGLSVNPVRRILCIWKNIADYTQTDIDLLMMSLTELPELEQ